MHIIYGGLPCEVQINKSLSIWIPKSQFMHTIYGGLPC